MEKAAEKKDWMEMMKIMQDIRQFCSLHVKRSPKGGISSAQELDLLSRLHLSENPMTPHSLCEKMGISRPLASRLIENLEMKGFLEKEVSEADKRSYFLRITELGSRELKGTYAYYLEPVYLLRTQMGEEKFGLLAGLLCECNRISGEKQQSQADGTDESGGRR